jgi:hypothetical protein
MPKLLFPLVGKDEKGRRRESPLGVVDGLMLENCRAADQWDHLECLPSGGLQTPATCRKRVRLRFRAKAYLQDCLGVSNTVRVAGRGEQTWSAHRCHQSGLTGALPSFSITIVSPRPNYNLVSVPYTEAYSEW